jgi:hypothetical protein
VILGYLLALLAAGGSGLGSVLESLGVRRADAYGGDSDDLGRVARQPAYWAGIVADLLAFVCAAAALHRLPLFLVQSVMAFSVGITALISHAMGIRMPNRAWYALVVGALGLVMLAVSALPGPAEPLPEGWRWVLLGMVAPIGVIAWFGNWIRDRWAAPLLAFGAGLGFAVVAISARSLPPFDSFGSFLSDQGVWAIAVNGVAATVVFAMALQNGSATTVSAVMFTTNTVVPSLIGLLVLGDTVRDGLEVVAVVGFLLGVGGAIALAHYGEVATIEHTETEQPARAGSHPARWGDAPSPADPDLAGG